MINKYGYARLKIKCEDSFLRELLSVNVVVVAKDGVNDHVKGDERNKETGRNYLN